MDRRRLLLVVAAVIAALGVALVFFYAQGAEKRAAEKFEAVDVVTVAAGQTILPGESVEAARENGKLVVSRVAKNQVLDGATDNTEALQGKVALTRIYAGEQLIPSKFGGVGDTVDVATLPMPTGMIAKSETFDIPVGSFVRPGSELAVFLSGNGGSTPTCLLLDRVSVVSVGATTEAVTDEEEAAVGAAPSLYLAVSQAEFELLEDAKKRGGLTVALTNSESKLEVDKSGPCAQLRRDNNQ